jgi:hypothetical protein
MIKQIKEKQSIFDFALQHCGSVEAAFDVMAVNGLKSFNLSVSAILKVPGIIEPKLVDYFISERAIIATKPPIVSNVNFNFSFSNSFS